MRHRAATVAGLQSAAADAVILEDCTTRARYSIGVLGPFSG